MFRDFPMGSALSKRRALRLNSFLPTFGCLAILKSFYVDHPHLIRFLCQHLIIVFRPITKFVASHNSSPDLYFVSPNPISTDARSAPEPCHNRLRMRTACRRHQFAIHGSALSAYPQALLCFAIPSPTSQIIGVTRNDSKRRALPKQSSHPVSAGSNVSREAATTSLTEWLAVVAHPSFATPAVLMTLFEWSLFERICFGASQGCDRSREQQLTSFFLSKEFRKVLTHRTAI